MPDWKTGQLILRDYLIEKELGSGGMGRVWLVKSNSTGRRFAVKQALIKDDKHRKAFLTELQTWIDLPEHPNIVPCRFFRTVGDEIVIFADFIEGGSLADWIAKKKLTNLERILDVAIQFAWGLHAIHERGLIHQDVKPGNVLMTAEGVPMVTDFGLARARMRGADGSFVSPALAPGQQSVLVSSGGMTPAYASPEQRAGQPLSRKTDIWSWGVSVLDMFMGEVSCPYGGHIAAEVLESYSERGMEDLLPPMPGGIRDILARCFVANPDDRWGDIQEIAELLEKTHKKLTGQPYGRRRPAIETTTGVRSEHDRLTMAGRTWIDPRTWLRKFYTIIGRDPEEAARAYPPSPSGSRRAQALADLAIYQEARVLCERAVAEGNPEYEAFLAQLCTDLSHVHKYLDDMPGCLACCDLHFARERLIFG